MFNSKKTSLLILIVTAIVSSRVMFMFFNDSEGPNLLIVLGMAVVVYAISFGAYSYYASKRQHNFKGLLLAIIVQVLLVAGVYVCLK